MENNHSRPRIISTITHDDIFCIRARNIPKATTNNIGPDTKREFAFSGHSEVKGQLSAKFLNKIKT